MLTLTISLKELKELHSIAFYARQASKLDDSKEGEKIETLSAKWDDKFHNLLKD